MNTTPRTLDVDVVSDVVCPWCNIGKRFLDAAIARLQAQAPEVAVRVRWHPYLLNPDTPPGGEPYRPFLERKFGGAAAVEEIWQRVRAAGERAGVGFAFERIERRPPTLDAHRLIRWQAARGDAAQLVDALFDAHFREGRDIGDPAVLAAIGAAATGAPADALRDWLHGDAEREGVLAEVAEAARIGVRGVPFFIFAGRLAVSGAQPDDVLLSAMHEALGQPAG